MQVKLKSVLTSTSFVVIGIMTITALLYIPSLSNGWVDWDDPAYVLNNDLVVNPTINWSEIFKENQVLGIYHPITLISYAFDYHLWGTEAFGFHLTNVIFHVLNTGLVFLVFRKLKSSTLVAATIALLFGIHPMHVESVSWISERKDVLYLFFFLLSWLSYLYYRGKSDRKKWLLYTLILLFFALSILSKPIAFVLPLVLLLSDYLLDRSWNWRFLYDKILIIGLAIVAFFIANWGQADSNSFSLAAEHPISTFFYGPYNAIYYVIKSVLPIGLSPLHPFPEASSSLTLFYLSLIPAIAIGYLLYRSFKASPKIFFGVAFFLVTIAPLLQIIPFGKALSSERYTYLPYLGLFFLIALFLEWSIQKSKWKTAITVGMSLWGIFLLQATYQQQSIWQDSETLWTQAIERYPDAYYPYLARGRYYSKIDAPEKAWTDINQSIELAPTPDAHYERGILNERNGNQKAAFSDYQSAIDLDESYSKAHANIGILYAKEGNRKAAFQHLEAALKADDEYSLAYFNLAILYKIEGKLQNALIEISNALKYEPYNLKYVELRAAIYTDLGEHQKAIQDFRKVLINTPDNATAQYYLARNYDIIGAEANAKKHFKAALKYGYKVPEIFLSKYDLSN